jgi:hypothetical protein
LSTPLPAEADKVAIQALLKNYHDSIRKREGEKAVACLDAETHQWYEDLRRDAVAMARADLEKQNLHRRFTILLFRHEFDAKTLKESTGPQLLGKGISKGWLDAIAAKTVRLTYVGSNGKEAYAETDTGVPEFFFKKDGESWKLSLTRSHRSVQQNLERLAQMFVGPMQFLRRQLEEATERPVDERIWDGPLEKISK